MALGAVRTQQFSGFYPPFFLGCLGQPAEQTTTTPKRIVRQFQTGKQIILRLPERQLKLSYLTEQIFV